MKSDKLEIVVNLHSDRFTKQVEKVQKELEKLSKIKMTYSIEKEDEPLLSVIKRKLQKRFGI